ncbi:MetQ/NlpA family ABC transporter substrate-binding protein [Fructobacillus parabroussonetiae]|uniref:Lipoprotein n=1 Tax=Fructobacillus parabroussonetiae TaxID=2713174 RepID=A0ABS5QXI0_9LACO|nr:MetQ/NlpA family ABC transporter substrate-binding protein [Fructobacillus parabroussonetiae]MBS9337066.1 MetQ/NlpA family ABC transporter substrate-binding protein [Fructobacillus parabroussonetiae]MCK8617586.1 MetQ/NlpA family ABC transporter substrate-binding protein [Fructobacillus parabroussonetiae]
MSKKKWFISGLIVIILAVFGYFSFGSHGSSNSRTVTVGIMSGNKKDDVIWKSIAKTAKDKYNVTLKFKTFSDYSQPNKALQNGDIDLNAFQHYAFLDAYNAKNGNKLTSIGETIIGQGRLYSKSYKSVDDFQNGDTIVIPNDPSNESRALYILQSAGLIGLKSGLSLATTKDITSNPKNLTIKEVAADQTARNLDSVQGAIINGNYAQAAGIDYQSAIFVEPLSENSHKWVNIIAARKSDKNKKIYQDVVKAYQTKTTQDLIKKEYGTATISAWDKNFK